ncbi:MAG: bifunctional phosphopantothenoylcysteine decarboxylase/phosphopantothenate--cysteine ligase CoaBC [Clostridia bacterium]|nr:bifunctional phosphopantothenoylcysteine decarboxylase/phosphopantothenate--cysteine ligase CoaBC [Clostridia bacterium]
MKMKKHLVIGVTGGIASYKALDVVSRLKKNGFDISVVMTKNACEFVTPLSFQTISQNRVITDMFEEPKTWEVEHIELTKKADAFLIVPATPNFIGKVASGIADDMLTTAVMASKTPIICVPSMNTNMYENPIFQRNVSKLKDLGYYFMDPDSGLLACGDVGKGKLPDPQEIVDQTIAILDRLQTKKDYIGKKVLVTAGPTIEAIDPVRYITNHSSGKMGFALAQEASQRGAEVVLIAGPVNLECSEDIKRVNVLSTRDMYDSVHQYFEWADVVIKAAAPSDYRPETALGQKLKKNNEQVSIHLTQNPDILKSLGENKGNKILVGFAAETDNLLEYAQDKIEKKNLDFIVANNVKDEGAGFKSDTNIVIIIDHQGEMIQYEKKTKLEVSGIILDKVKQYM